MGWFEWSLIGVTCAAVGSASYWRQQCLAARRERNTAVGELCAIATVLDRARTAEKLTPLLRAQNARFAAQTRAPHGPDGDRSDDAR